MKNFILLFVLLPFVCMAQVKGDNSTDSGRWSQRFSDFADEQKLKAKVKLLDLELLEAIELGLRYKYQVLPNHFDDLYTRVDGYVLNGGLKPGDLLDESPLFIHFADQMEVLFTQQFENGKEARKLSNAYLPKHLPLESSKALALKPGDYVRFSAQMTFSVGAKQIFPVIVDVLETNANMQYLMSGGYEFHVFRMDESKIRLRLVAKRVKERQFEVEFGTSKYVELFGAKLLDKEIVKVLDLDEYFKFRKTKEYSNLFLLDYTLDLSDPQVRKIYDELFHPKKIMGDSFQVRRDAISGSDDIRSRLVSDISALDDLSVEAASVVRNFKGSNVSVSRKKEFRFGIAIKKIKKDEIFRHNFLTSVEREQGIEKEKYYIYPTWSFKGEHDSLIFPDSEFERIQTANALFSADQEGKPTGFLGIRFSANLFEKKVSNSEFVNLVPQMLGVLPEKEIVGKFRQELYAKAWTKDVSSFDLQNTLSKMNVKLSYAFKRKALKILSQGLFGPDGRQTLNKQTLEYEAFKFFKKFTFFQEMHERLVTKFVSRYSYRFGNEVESRANAFADQKLLRMLSRELKIDNLAQIFDPKIEGKKRLSALEGLRTSKYFRKYGTNFLSRLLERACELTGEPLEHVVSVDIEMSANAMTPVSYKFGSFDNIELMQNIQFIEQLLNDDGRDIRQIIRLEKELSKMNLLFNESAHLP